MTLTVINIQFKIDYLSLSKFQEIDENGNEFWGARKLSKAFEYTDFRNFLVVIEKAKETCKNRVQSIENHAVDFNEMVKMLA